MPTDRTHRWLSWIIPVRAERAEGRFGTLEVRWTLGRKVLDSATANQSFGSLHRVWQVVFQRLRLRERPPASVLLLGLGGGSVVHILRTELGIHAPITAVELDPVMHQLARTHFGLDLHADVEVLIGDATVQVHALPHRYALVVVDLFDGLDLAIAVDSAAFVKGLRARCGEGGVICFNTVDHDAQSHGRCEKVGRILREQFPHVREERLEGVNRVFIAW